MTSKLSSIRFNSCQKSLTDWALINVTGADREDFFQGQVTNDLKSLPFGEAQVTVRLNRTGKIQSFFTIARLENNLFLLCPKEMAQIILDDFNKFIIMDDVELTLLEDELHLHFNPILDERGGLFKLNFYGISAELHTKKLESIPLADEKELEEVRFLNGYPKWKQDVDETYFINDSYLNDIAISYKKGCFLGQETVAKIENNRGAAYYPVLLKMASATPLTMTQFFIEGKKAGELSYQKDAYVQARLFRDFRVEGRRLKINVLEKEYEAIVHYLPFYKNQTPIAIADELFHLGVEEFQKAQIDPAMEYMKKAIDFNPALSDAYESIGVILGRKEKYQEAIEWMDKLLAVNKSSVLAHTNKSLFLMKLGKIEEAEAEKSLATVKSFSMYGEEAKVKKALAEEKAKKEADLLRREQMFTQVLEMDEDDTIALYGLGDIAFFRHQFQEAVNKLSRVIILDEKYSTAYLLLGKSLEALGEIPKARGVYEKGIEVASKRGDMMPANEMQSRLNQLVVGPSTL